MSRAPVLRLNLITAPMTEESDTVEGVEVASLLFAAWLFADPVPVCELPEAGGGPAAAGPPVPADDEEALEAALPLRLWAFEKLREFACCPAGP